MIALIIKSYIAILLPIFLGALFVFILGLYFILKPKRTTLTVVPMEMDNQEMNVEKIATTSKEQDSLLDLVNELQKDKKEWRKPNASQASITITSSDISAIAGDDVLATQLDLARAYIETGRKQLAKKILEHVALQGSDAQQNEARTLLGLI